MCHVIHPAFQLGLGGQLTEQRQIGYFEVVALLRQLFDRIPAVPKNPLLTIDERHGALARSRVRETGVVAQHPEIGIARLDLANVLGRDGGTIFRVRPVHDREFVLLLSPVVDDRQRISHFWFS